MSSASGSLAILVDIGFAPALAAEALEKSGHILDDAITFCLQRAQENITKHRIEQQERAQYQARAVADNRLLRMTADTSKSPFTSYIGIIFENLTSTELNIHISQVLIHRCGLDSDGHFNSETFKIQTPSGNIVDPSFRIDLDPYETREYAAIVESDCLTDMHFIIKAVGMGAEFATEGIKTHQGSSKPGGHPRENVSIANGSTEENVRALDVGEIYYVSKQSRDSAGCAGLELYYQRLSRGDLRVKFDGRYPHHGGGKRCLSGNAPVSAKTYGSICPSCGGRMEELERYTSSDGMMGIERDLWACPDETCGIIRVCNYEGYGSV